MAVGVGLHGGKGPVRSSVGELGSILPIIYDASRGKRRGVGWEVGGRKNRYDICPYFAEVREVMPNQCQPPLFDSHTCKRR